MNLVVSATTPASKQASSESKAHHAEARLVCPHWCRSDLRWRHHSCHSMLGVLAVRRPPRLSMPVSGQLRGGACCGSPPHAEQVCRRAET